LDRDAKSWPLAILPDAVRALISRGRRKLRQLHQENRDKRRPAQDVFSEVYSKNLWGGENGEFFSGVGSRYVHAELYVDGILKFIRETGIRSIIDLGCGDFEIGRRLAGACDRYIGVDVVPELVDRNSRLYGTPHIRFICADISREPLPDAELCLVRQVFQHMSNSEIGAVLREARKYRHLIVTEHHPVTPLAFNKDKIHGFGTRVEAGSGVYLDKAPFNVRRIQLLLETAVMAPNEDGEPTPLPEWGLLRTFLVQI
jgi:SAM-dependent methyltransferase